MKVTNTNPINIDGRRILNMIVAAIGLALAIPAMIFIAIVIKLTSNGPIIYNQVRVGVNRRSLYSPTRSNKERRSEHREPGTVDRRRGWYIGAKHRREENLGGMLFTMHKFRTMTVNEKNTIEQWATQNDSRVTPIGRILRKFRLDELPQLYNVLCGDMNIVGPRPEQPTIFVSLQHKIFGYEIRQRELPGITGLAQISQGYDTCIDDVQNKIFYDLKYVTRPSIRNDLAIMLKTIPTMAFGRGAR